MNHDRPFFFRLAVQGLLALITWNAQAQVTIQVGDLSLLPNTPDQTITINVTGVAGASGLDFFIQVADGYPNVSGSTLNGPNITAVDIVTGTLFGANNDGGQFGAGLGLQHQYRGVLTSAGTVSGAGLLATVTLDTTGLSSGTWALSVKNVVNGPTQFYDAAFDPIPAAITDGTLTVVPEPAACGSAVGALLLGLAVCRRRRGGNFRR